MKDNEVFDGDDLLARRVEDSLAHIKCPKVREAVKKRRRCAEEIVVCEMLLRAWQIKHGMEVDPTVLTEDELSDRRRITLCYAAALEAVNRRGDGIDALRLHLGVVKECFKECNNEQLPSLEYLDVSAALALAKLYFKNNQKDCALSWCDAVLNKLRMDKEGCCSGEDISDAYHLAGWIRIHSDDHTGAYQLWTEGHGAVPECDTLGRQYRKRACWDNRNDEEVTNPLLLGEGAHGNGVFLEEDFDAFVVPEHNEKQTPALALFCKETQMNALVFRTRRPVLTAEECARVLEEVDSFHDNCRGGRWGTVRHSSVTTTDVAVEDIPVLRPWLRDLLRTRLYPFIARAYPQLADGSTPGDLGNRVRVHDAFIVRYDAENDKSYSLPEHSDTSAISFTVALNSQSDDDSNSNNNNTPSSCAFEGGGTWFEALGDSNKSGMVVDANVGQAVAFAGPLRHAGFPVRKGVRVILVLFLYIDGFSYGSYLEKYIEKHGVCNICEEEEDEKKDDPTAKEHFSTPKVRPSGDMPGGFVVYNQTVELVGMLNRRVESVLD